MGVLKLLEAGAQIFRHDGRVTSSAEPSIMAAIRHGSQQVPPQHLSA